MATFNKFETFAGDLGKGIHDLQAAGHVLKVYLTNATPSASLDAVKADLAEITAENGYPAGGTDIQNDFTETSGVGTLTGVDVVFTATAGGFGPFQYAVIYNDTPTVPADPLVCWWENPGGSVSVSEAQSVTIDFGASILTIT